MHNPSRFRSHVLLIGGLMVAACSVDNKGITLDVRNDGGQTDLAGVVGGGGSGASSGGGIGTGTGGGAVGTGGELGSGGAVGTGGSVGTGGELGSGGAVGTGGSIGAGGRGGGGRGGAGGAGGRGGGAGGRGGANAGGCNATTCANGCCNGTMCVTNRNNQRCGTAGAACAPCGPCLQCSAAGVCALNPASVWDVICSSAQIEATMPTNAAWDNGSVGNAALPDPFCEFTLNGNAQVRTPAVNNTLMPMWDQSISPPNQNVTQNFLIARNWGISVIDDDGAVALNDRICDVTPMLTADDFAAGTVTFPATQSCLALTIQLVCTE